MGTNNSSEENLFEKTVESDDRVEYMVNIINDVNINKIKLEQTKRLTEEDKKMFGDAQVRATCELNNFMRNCEFHIILADSLIIIRSGDCRCKVSIARDDNDKIEWHIRNTGLQGVFDNVHDLFCSLLGRDSNKPKEFQQSRAINWY